MAARAFLVAAATALGACSDPRIPDGTRWLTRHEPFERPAMGAIQGDLLMVSGVAGRAVAERFDADSGRLVWSRALGGTEGDEYQVADGSSDSALVAVTAADGWDISSLGSRGEVESTQHWAAPGALAMTNNVMAVSSSTMVSLRPYGAEVDSWTAPQKRQSYPVIASDGDVAVWSVIHRGQCASSHKPCECILDCPDDCVGSEDCVFSQDLVPELWLTRFTSDGTQAWAQQVGSITSRVEHPLRNPVVYLPDGDLVIVNTYFDFSSTGLVITRLGRDQQSRWSTSIELPNPFYPASAVSLSPKGDIIVGGRVYDETHAFRELGPNRGYLLTVSASDGSQLDFKELYEGVNNVSYGSRAFVALPLDVLGMEDL